MRRSPIAACCLSLLLAIACGRDDVRPNGESIAGTDVPERGTPPIEGEPAEDEPFEEEPGHDGGHVDGGGDGSVGGGNDGGGNDGGGNDGGGNDGGTDGGGNDGAAGDGGLACIDHDLGSALPVLVSGTTAGRTNDFAPDCHGPSRGGSDFTYLWTAPRSGTFVFSTSGSSYSAAADVYPSCTGAPLGCGEAPDDDGDGPPSPLGTGQRLTLTAGQRVLVVVDSRDDESGGAFQLAITGVGRESSCSNGIDDDGNGRVDCADEACGGNVGCVEDGPNCLNGRDEDVDGLVDCDDPDCAPYAEGGALTGPFPIVVHGDATGKGNDYQMVADRCVEGIPNPDEDVTYSFTPPTTGTYRFTATPSESVQFGVALGIVRSVCGTPDIACQAYDVPAGVSVALVAGETVLVVVEPNRMGPTGTATFVLRVERLP